MNRKFFITIFIGAHIIYVSLLIHKQNIFIDLSYQKQKYEQQKLNLLEQKKEFVQKLCALKKHKDIKNYALQHLNMESITMKQIRKLNT